MSVLLLGRWDLGGNLVIEESHQIEDGDQATADALVDDQGDENNDAWAAEFDVDRHSDAIQRAYEEYVADEGTRLIDEVEGHEPVTIAETVAA
ncbi:hypothetical protein ACPCSC_30825 [Streptomyces lavendulocolor]|uniref:hypothetical protein n=1 Tax=Streptomyces lavendulocolor TaxID=67316 RepID=UPI003C2DB123